MEIKSGMKLAKIHIFFTFFYCVLILGLSLITTSGLYIQKIPSKSDWIPRNILSVRVVI